MRSDYEPHARVVIGNLCEGGASLIESFYSQTVRDIRASLLGFTPRGGVCGDCQFQEIARSPVEMARETRVAAALAKDPAALDLERL